MKSKIQIKIEKYVLQKIVPRSVIELRDMLLYLQLIRYSKYRKLASLTNSIYEIPGMDNISESVQKLDNKLARRYFYLKKLSFSKRINDLLGRRERTLNANDKEQRLYLFSVLKDKVLERIRTITTIHNLKLVNTYPTILSEILKKRAQLNTNEREDLKEAELVSIISSLLEKDIHDHETVVRLRGELALEYIRNKKELDILFQYLASPEQIKIYQEEFQHILQKDIEAIFREAVKSEFFEKGTYLKIPSGVKAGLKTYFLVSIPINILITLALHYLTPLIPVTLAIPYLVPVVIGMINIMPVIISIFAGAFYNHRSQKQDTHAKNELKLALASVVEDYLVRLNKKEIDLTGIHRYWKSNAEAKSQKRLFRSASSLKRQTTHAGHPAERIRLFKRSASPSSVTSNYSSDREPVPASISLVSSA